MSHKGTNWAIAQRGLKPTAKIILWQLCDRHHPDHGCFPSQDTLAHDCEISRGTLNRHLDDLEAAGLIRRIQRSDKKSRRQMSTMYFFAFDFDDPYGFDPSAEGPETDPDDAPESGGEGADIDRSEGDEPCVKMRHGAVSQNRQKPCLKKRDSRVSKRDTNPVIEPLKNPRAGAPPGGIVETARFWAEAILQGRYVPPTALTETIKAEIEASGLLDEAQMLAHGITSRKRAG